MYMDFKKVFEFDNKYFPFIVFAAILMASSDKGRDFFINMGGDYLIILGVLATVCAGGIIIILAKGAYNL